MSETIAVYGGSFDPPHVAHTLVVAYVLATEAVDQVLVVPTAHHAFDKPLSPFAHRVRMCELAMRHLHKVEVSHLESELERPSLTLRTLERLGALYPKAKLRLVVGSDILDEAPNWHGWEEIKQLAPLIVIPRAGRGQPSDDFYLPDVSSTEVRKRLRAGQSVVGLMDREVERYATEHALYR